MTDDPHDRSIAMQHAVLSERGKSEAAAAVGPYPRSESYCDCPPGWRHEPDCPQVRDDEDDDA